MVNPVAGENPPERRTLAAGLAATWVVQVMGTMAVFGVPVLAPVIAPEMGIDPTLVGIYVAICYLTAQVTGLMSGGFIDRFGALRLSQASCLLAALGIVALFPALVWLAPLAAVLMGCCYGPLNPTSSKILRGLGDARHQPLIFSVKQTGVPVAGVLVGALLPVLTVEFGWRVAFGVFALLAVIVAIALQPIRETFDSDRDRAGGRPRIEIMGPLRLVLKDRALRGMSLVGFALAGSQICVSSFYVLYLTQVQGWSLVNAGMIYAVVQGGGIAGRLVWGSVASHLFRPAWVLGGLSLIVALLFALVAAMTPAWPLPAVVVLSAVLGLCSFGWNGVWLSEVSDLAPESRIGAAMGGAQFIMFGGVTVLPPLFGTLVDVTGSYIGPFAGTAAFVVLMAGYMAITRRRRDGNV